LKLQLQIVLLLAHLIAPMLVMQASTQTIAPKIDVS
jgi:hypothetical protein